MNNNTTDYPYRHGDYAQMCQWVKQRRIFLKGDSKPSLERWQQLGKGLQQGDTLADSVVEWMHDFGMRPARGMFEKALKNGIDSLSPEEQQVAQPLIRFFNEVETEPEWLDKDLLAQGGRVIDRCHPVSYYILRNAGLMAGYLSSDLNKPLIMTGELANGANRRFAQTMKWFSDCVSPHGLERDGEGFRSTIYVRIMHALVRHRLSKNKEWDHSDMGLPINQTDMIATWLAFSVVFLAGARTMGVIITPKESKAVMHLWRYTCWLMGVDAEWLNDDEHESRKLLFHTLATFRGPDENSRQLGRALMEDIPLLPFPKLKPLKWRYEQAKHLSVTMLFVGPSGMKKLGLPWWVPPWYPLLSAGLNIPRSLLLRIPSPLQRRAELKGRAHREALIKLHFGITKPDLASLG